MNAPAFQPLRLASSREYADGAIFDRQERADINFDAGKELGMQEAELAIATFARQFKFDPKDSVDANARRFIGEFVGHLDNGYDDLSSAIRAATHICED